MYLEKVRALSPIPMATIMKLVAMLLMCMRTLIPLVVCVPAVVRRAAKSIVMVIQSVMCLTPELI